jgi:predicted secreted hydrolase
MLKQRLLDAARGLAWRLLPKVEYPPVLPGYKMTFPRDHGAHPEFRVEWWYIAGRLRTKDGSERTFQITFFRNRDRFLKAPGLDRLRVRQLLFCHIVIVDPTHGEVLFREIAGEPSVGLENCSLETTRVGLPDWHLELSGDTYKARLSTPGVEMELRLTTAHLPMLNGEQGYSEKANGNVDATYYYSRPQLTVEGSLNGEDVWGIGWLDHEWFNRYIEAHSAGWEWAALNLTDGSSLLAFQVSGKDSNIRGAGTLRTPDGDVRNLQSGDVRFEPLRTWHSPRTGVEYPVATRLHAGDLVLVLEPLVDDIEFDQRESWQVSYWEGPVTVVDGDTSKGTGVLSSLRTSSSEEVPGPEKTPHVAGPAMAGKGGA